MNGYCTFHSFSLLRVLGGVEFYYRYFNYSIKIHTKELPFALVYAVSVPHHYQHTIAYT